MYIRCCGLCLSSYFTFAQTHTHNYYISLGALKLARWKGGSHTRGLRETLLFQGWGLSSFCVHFSTYKHTCASTIPLWDYSLNPNRGV